MAFALLVALDVVSALVTAGLRVRRALGLLIALGMLALPWFGAWPITRAALALAGIAGCGRVIDLARKRRPLTPMRRIWHVLSPIDSWQARSATPAFDTRAAGRLLRWGGVAAVGLALVLRAPHDAEPWHYWAQRWVGGLLLIYGLADVMHASLAVVYRLGGRAIPLQHRTPLASASIQEFWGARWNLTVSGWLDRNIFRQLARGGHAGWAIAFSFIVSAAIHAYFTLAAIGLRMALWMGVYFLLQGLFVLIERPLGTARWRSVPAHLWVTVLMLLSSPLFTEPFLQVVGLPPS